MTVGVYNYEKEETTYKLYKKPFLQRCLHSQSLFYALLSHQFPSAPGIKASSRVSAGKTAVVCVQQVMGLMESLVITLHRYITREVLLKINYTPGLASGHYL